jgi:hypothetical protein
VSNIKLATKKWLISVSLRAASPQYIVSHNNHIVDISHITIISVHFIYTAQSWPIHHPLTKHSSPHPTWSPCPWRMGATWPPCGEKETTETHTQAAEGKLLPPTWNFSWINNWSYLGLISKGKNIRILIATHITTSKRMTTCGGGGR